MYNPTIQDLRDGKWSIENTGGSLEDLKKILKHTWPDHNNELNGTAKIYFRIDGSRFFQAHLSSPIPSKPIPYWLSLIDPPEYIYELFDEEKAKNGADVVMKVTKGKVNWYVSEDTISAINAGHGLALIQNIDLLLRRKVVTKEIRCYTYETPNGAIKVLDFKHPGDWRLLETFTHKIKMPS